VAFFPQLVAGPIERASRLLPQITTPRLVTLEKVYEGGFLIFWGLFQKIVVADNLAKIVDPIFSANNPQNGLNIIIAIYAFAFQIFCDFAGYSNIARGVSKCLGIEIMVNFNLPYFSTNPREFWRRWHISLSTWLRDYLYIPLGGNRFGKTRTYINLMITMLLGGLWHGAGWSFVVWGAYQGVLLTAHRLVQPVLQRFSLPENSLIAKLGFWLRVAGFFQLICIGWVLFRSQSIYQTKTLLVSIITNFEISHGLGIRSRFQTLIFFTAILIIIQLVQHKTKDLMVVTKFPKPVMGALFGVMFCLMVQYAITGNSFIYFQF
jgi:D-alanyl-lipoteichoic acid acyltransferase DltB (MBOAT superfamily)